MYPFRLRKLNLTVRSFKLLGFLTTLGFILFADSIASYLFPIYIERIVSSATILGLILTANTFIAIVFDFFLPRILNGKGWHTSFFLALFSSILFTITMYFAVSNSSVILLLLASMIMGIYMEALIFSVQEFIPAIDSKNNFTKDWNLVWGTWGIGSIGAPIIGSFFLTLTILHSTFGILMFQISAIITLTIFLFLIGNKNKTPINSEVKNEERLAFRDQLKIWYQIAKKAWPALILSMVYALHESIFWSLQGVFGEEQFSSLGFGWIIAFAYGMTDIITAVIFGKLNIIQRKKFYSYEAFFIGSLVMLLIPYVVFSPVLTVISVLIVGVMTSGSNLLNLAVISDLQERAIKFSGLISGLQRLAFSIGFLFGPLFGGIIADSIGYSKTFAIVGIIGASVSLILYLTAPRKIRLPLKEMNMITNSNN